MLWTAIATPSVELEERPDVITEAERDFIRHALGLTNPDARKVGYRNRYSAGGDDVETGRSLVRKGMAVHFPPDPGFRPDDLFMITTRGFDAAREPDETMDREETATMKRLDARAYPGAEITTG